MPTDKNDDGGQQPAVPAPEKIVPYQISGDDGANRGALYLYGNPKSSRMALCCAGFADDHTVFQPFAAALSRSGVNNNDDTDDGVFVGVMCLPGYDDRPDDDVPWTSHPADGYTADQWTGTIREAAVALRSASTHDGATLTGIFHDWAVPPGILFVERALKEVSATYRPDCVVYFDVLLGPSPASKDIPLKSELVYPTLKHTVCSSLYKIVLAKSFLLQRHLSKFVAAVCFILEVTVLELFGLGPLKAFDSTSVEPLYVDHPKSLFRILYMSFPYWTMIMRAMLPWGKKLAFSTLHDDWKKCPILYMYGRDKNTMFHDPASLKMLEDEPHKENGSVSQAIGLTEAGHFLYVPLQQMERCVTEVRSFMDAAAAAARAAN
mmetsp:Transcript_10929/g.21636  ORF Transcript_10929/g.21636 Transcript_10929/m.21636 type:complete len:378 (-) Transcript_10929:400-1533(-)|eukprot:CAMPEP_0194324940 /NCGR_PEP_ID=MMETSP0171-20130528/28946_1 /TAXON_ID=218684 /ORGANISM="Corethron pennatum, Strain L29A3" /LENGTH=377 /DNA_ID=CAMNT_0039083935 /DNA_START=25 /DNA_END=1158 /DNA_ORIENTATION=-